MKAFTPIILTLVAFLMIAGPTQATELEQYKENVQAALSKGNVISMMEIAKLLKEHGASYQKDLTVQPALAKKWNEGESLRIMIGVYQFDAIYAAAFGRKQDTIDFLNARALLVDKMNLRGQMDVSALFPKALEPMLKNPDGVTFDDVVQAYADKADTYKEMMDYPIGFETIEASLYGFVLEGLYIVGNSALMSGMDPEVMRTMGQVSTMIQPLMSLYDNFTSVDNYAKYVDPDNFLEVGERAGWLKLILKMIIDKKGNLNERQVKAIIEIVSKERAAIFAAIR